MLRPSRVLIVGAGLFAALLAGRPAAAADLTARVDHFLDQRLREENAASHPQLLRELTDGFVASGFDVKGLYRTLCNSRAYQRTSRPAAGNEDAAGELFSRMAVKPLTPEQLYDSLLAATGTAPVVKGKAARAGARTMLNFVLLLPACAGIVTAADASSAAARVATCESLGERDCIA